MYLITVYNLTSNTYESPVIAHSEHAMNEYVRTVWQSPGPLLMTRVDRITDDQAIDNLRQNGAKTVRYDKGANEKWHWVAK